MNRKDLFLAIVLSIIAFFSSHNLIFASNLPTPPRENAPQEEYTITFRTDLPANDLEETKKYTSNKDCPLPMPTTYGYTFAGWEDEKDQLIKDNIIYKNTVARDIILKAKWISNRNKYYSEPVKKHSIIEDEEDSKFYFIYKVGRIENVPLEEGQKFGHHNQGESYETTKVEEREFTTENAKTVSKDIQRKSINSSSVTVATTKTESFSSTESNSTSNSESMTEKEDVSGWNKVLNNITIPFFNIKASTVLKIGTAIFRPDRSKKNANEVTSNQETIDKISNSIENKSTSKTKNTSESSSNSQTTTSTNEYGTTERNSSTITYTEGMKLSKSEKHTLRIDYTGNYREVVAGTVHIYKVVGYNLRTKEIFTFDHYRIDNEIHTFLDYSFDNASFNDRESVYDASFSIPEEVFTHISNRICETEGLLFTTEGSIEEYEGESDTVLIPEYSCIAGEEEEDGDVIKVTAIEPGVFKDNTNIKRVVLSDFITEIPDDTFDGCESLEYVWGGNISKIGNNAFRGCKSLKKIAGENITEIADCAFSGCQSLEKYTISSKVKTVGKEAFKEVHKIIVQPENTEILKATISSGAKEISIYTNSLNAESLSGTISIPKNIEYFYFGENGSKKNKKFKNLTIESYAQLSIFENIDLINEQNIPLKLYSKNVQFLNINIASGGISVVFYTKDVNLGLFDTIEIKSNSEYAILSKGINPKLAKSSRRGVLATQEKVGICGNKNNSNMRELSKRFKRDKKRVSPRDQSATIAFINEQQFQELEMEQPSTVTIDMDFEDSEPKKPLTGKINFDSNGGSYVSLKDYTVGKPLGELPTPTRELYSFDGWYTDAINGQKITNDSIFKQGGNITLYAHWKQDSISDWTLANQIPTNAKIVSEAWTYDEVEYKRSGETYLPGWERYDVEYNWGDYGRWSDWQRSPVYNSDTRQVDTRYIEPQYHIQYNYSRYRPVVGRTCSPKHGFFAGRLCVKYQERGWGEKLYECTFKGVDAYSTSSYVDEKDLWFNETTKKTELRPGGMEYRYRDRTKVVSAYYYRKTEHKESQTEVKESAYITNVQKWVKYIKTK